jgi:hypothetical protein
MEKVITLESIRKAEDFNQCNGAKNVMGDIISSIDFKDWNFYEVNSECGTFKHKYGIFRIVEKVLNKHSSKPNLVVMAGFSVNSFCGSSEIILNTLKTLEDHYRAIYIICYDEQFKEMQVVALNASSERFRTVLTDAERANEHDYNIRTKIYAPELEMEENMAIAIDKVLRCPQLNLRNVHLLGKSAGCGLAMHIVSKSSIYNALYLAVPANSTYLMPLEKMGERLRTLKVIIGWNANDAKKLYKIPSNENRPKYEETIDILKSRFGEFKTILETYSPGNFHEINPELINTIVRNLH